jgi:hypothetical protein
MNTEIVEPPNQQQPKANTYYIHYSQDIILMDASWDVSHRAGMGALLYNHIGEFSDHSFLPVQCRGRHAR